MSQDWYADVREFHVKVMGDNFPSSPCLPGPSLRELRETLIREEVWEVLQAIQKGDLVELADGIADSIVVLLGTAITYGVDIRPIWDEVHQSNMSKIGGSRRGDGKILKPNGWEPPDVEGILRQQGANL